jgi:hypothetical protein
VDFGAVLCLGRDRSSAAQPHALDTVEEVVELHGFANMVVEARVECCGFSGAWMSLDNSYPSGTGERRV